VNPAKVGIFCDLAPKVIQVRKFSLLTALFALIFLAALPARTQQPTDPQPVELLVPAPVGIPHATDSYTQGLLLYDGWLYESDGEYGKSSLRRVDPATGEVVQQFDLLRANLEAAGWLDEAEANCTLTPFDEASPQSGEFFAEGLALVGNRLIQLTWREQCAIIYDRETFEILDIISYDAGDETVEEGWGLCYDRAPDEPGGVLYMSDGSANLFTRDPETLELLDTIPVTYQGQPINNLNELECVGDAIYANIYMTNFIVRIEKATGQVTGIIDASNLLTPEERAGANVLNGIAHIEGDRFYITGKLWPRMFEVRFIVAQG
jgi:glutamine cyclotransferase